MNSSNRATLTISKIRKGTVIDHIPAGKALDILRLLKITGKEGLRIAIIMNVESKKLGKKDIIKIEGKELGPEEVNIIALIAPTATINIVEDFEVKKKFRVEVPEIIEGIFRCPNPTCITAKQGEPIKPRFRVVSRNPLRLQCEYCGTIITEKEMMEYRG